MRFKDINSEQFFNPLLAEKEAIVKAIAYFDMFDFPLTAMEIWRALNIKCGLGEVIGALENLTGQAPEGRINPDSSGGSRAENGEKPDRRLERKNGFYFLAGRGSIVITRLERYNTAGRKYKRAIRVAKIFKSIPWIKMIALGNVMGSHNLKNESDLDLFIVTEEKRIWIARFFCVMIASILGLRPKPGKTKDKICLSFFISRESMDLSSLMLNSPSLPPRQAVGETDLYQGGEAKAGRINPPHPSASASRKRDGPLLKGSENVDVYFIHWLAGLAPLYEEPGFYQKFIKANGWLKSYLPNWTPQKISKQRSAGASWPRFYREMADLFIGGLEPWFKKLELRLLDDNLKALMNMDTRVVINDRALKLHANDRREEYRQQYKKKISNF